ncbi:eotaxin-like [Siniperca chuatsi]|uniref:eotaxin-like n=1 Tax=Siniperca chuatsi TaxID=119488 RepID=UPI001CE0EBDA|nr:eotaxin-like [Siniperca chuatsi]
MRFSLVLAALLCFSTWMSMVHATHGPVSSCCMQWSKTRVPVERIMDYTIQSEGVCPITAIIFQTKFGKRLCSDPNNKWAKKAILKVDVEKKALLENRQNEDESTSNITPTVSTTSKNAPQKKGRNGRRRQRKKSRRGRKGQRKRV